MPARVLVEPSAPPMPERVLDEPFAQLPPPPRLVLPRIRSYFASEGPRNLSYDARGFPLLTDASLEAARRESIEIQKNPRVWSDQLREAKTALARAEKEEDDMNRLRADARSRYRPEALSIRGTPSEAIAPREVPMTSSSEAILPDGTRISTLNEDGSPWVYPSAPKYPPPHPRFGGTRRMQYNKKQNKQSKHRFRSRVSTSNLRRYSKSKRISRKRLHKRR